MTDINFSLELAQQLVNSSDEFCVDFDLLWECCGYSKKSNARRTLTVNFQQDIEFCSTRSKTLSDGRPSELIKLTTDCAKEFALLAQTENGKKIRQYFIEAEKQLRQKTESDRSILERNYQPSPTIKDLKDMVGLLQASSYSQAFVYQYVHMQTNKHFPAIAPMEMPREERPSLPILLTPTEIAQQLDINYQTGNPNPRKVNSLLEQLGYQIKINGSWQPADKAIQFDHYDIKPVDTNSKSQKSQLLWTQLMVNILKEFAIV